MRQAGPAPGRGRAVILFALLLAFSFLAPYAAGVLIERSIVKSWEDYGFTPDQTRQWWDNGVIYRGEAIKWRAKEFAPPEAARWIMVDIPPDEAKEWKEGEFTLEEALKWRRQAFAPMMAAEWSRQGFGMGDAIAWRKYSFEPKQAARWKEKGYSPVRAQEAIAMGKDP